MRMIDISVVELIAAKRAMITAGWTFCGSVMHDKGATGNFGLLYVKDGKRFYLNKDTFNGMEVGPFDDLTRFEKVRTALINRANSVDKEYETLFRDRACSISGWIEDIKNGWPIDLEYVRSAVAEFEKMV